MKILSACLLLSLVSFVSCHAQQEMKKGFDLSNASVPVDQIVDGGPPRDGIPSIDEPRRVGPGEADFLDADDRVLGVSHQGVTKAYPVKILNWHEIVNDRFGNHPVTVSYCPLCGSGMAFDARVAGKDRTFGVSGLLYNNDVLLYDRQSETLWSQIESKAVAGPLKGKELEYIETAHTTWEKWKEQHPQTRVLSDETGYSRDYSSSPYAGYREQKGLMFPTSHKDDRYHPKAWVLGVRFKGQYKVYPFPELRKANTPVKDRFAGITLEISYDRENQQAFAIAQQEKKPETMIMYWFAWMAFHPESEVFTAGEN